MAKVQPEASDRHYVDRVVRLPELVSATMPPVLKGYTFTGCEIHGPAVVIPVGKTTLMHCVFDGTLESMFWEIPPTRKIVTGAIALEDCTLERCTFRSIGFAGDRNLHAQLAGIPQGPPGS